MPLKTLAVASSGGHWVQLKRLSPLLNKYDCTYLTTSTNLNNSKVLTTNDANFKTPILLLKQAFSVLIIK